MKKSTFNRIILAGVAAAAIFPTAGAMAANAASAESADGPAIQTASNEEAAVNLAAADALAANEPQVAASGALSGDQGIETIVVTARRRAENIQDVPLSLQAISGETLELKGTVDLQSLISQTPGLNSTGGNPRNFSVLIRGIGYAPTAADGLDNAIGVYFDGVYQARPGQVLQDLVDVNSFEVLRGPQGTLFGRNAAAGALNVTSNRPSFTPAQSFEASVGNYSFFQLKAISTGPITDNVAYRTSIYGTNSTGWLNTPFKRSFRNAAALEGIYAPTATNQTVTAGTGRYGIRQQFLINPSDKLSINIAGDLENENDSSSGFSSGGGVKTVFGPGNWGINTTAAQQATATKAFAALSSLRSFDGVQSWPPAADTSSDISNNLNAMRTVQGGVAVTADYDLDWASVTSITAWRFWKFSPPQDSDGSPLDIYQNEAISRSDQYSEELRLASNGKGPFEWQTGAFFYYSKLQDHYIIHQFGADVIPWYNAYQGRVVIPISFRSQLTGSQIIEDTHVQDQNEAVYGQATWHILDDLDLTGGAR